MKILIIDKSSTMRRILKNILSQLGHKDIIEAKDEQRGFKVITNEPVDLVFLDWNLSVKKGLEFLELMKAQEKLKAIPVFAVSDIIQKDKVIMALRAGALEFIAKPFSEKIIKQKIESFFKDKNS